MASQLLIEEIGPAGATPLGRVEGDRALIGREPDDNGVVVPSEAISRNHGLFFRVGPHWLYRDLGSTNGSWIDGNPVKTGGFRVVRSGSVLQLATVALKISVTGTARDGSQSGGSRTASILVFSGDRFIDEYPIPELGRALVIGGSQGDLRLEGDIYEMPSLVIERKGSRVVVFQMAKDIPVKLNFTPLTDVQGLKDGDFIAIGQYQLTLNLPPVQSIIGREQMGPKDWAHEEASPASRVGTSSRPNVGSALFGGRAERGEEEEIADRTMAMNPDLVRDIYGGDMSTSMRYKMQEGPSSYLDTSEGRFVVLVLMVLLALVLAIVVWWFFFS